MIDPLTLADAKSFLRVEVSTDDTLITDLITAAKLECESILSRSFVNTTWKVTLDYFPPYSSRLSSLLPPAITGPLSDRNYWLNLSDTAIQLPMPPLVSVTTITYVDQNGATQTLDPSSGAGNVAISLGTPGQITPGYGKIFPPTLPILGAVNITYVAGYGATAASVPRNIVNAMRFLVSLYYEHRTASIETPEVIMNLLNASAWGMYA